MEVFSYGAFSWTHENEVKSIYLWPPSKSVEAFPTVENVSGDSILTVSGLVDGSRMSMLLSDERILLVDLIANQIHTQLASRYGEAVPLDHIGVPTPAWLVFTESIVIPDQ
jgi:hypothetical protein